MQTSMITVVTPVYKTDLQLLIKAFNSLKDQTLGFDLIKWVVVVHNSGQEYYEKVCSLFGDHKNVLIKQLDDGNKGPSSPRNLGIDMVDTEYIAFLDSDDTYEKNCFKEALESAERNHSDITVFRRRYSLESEKLSRVTEVVLWNQFLDEIVIDRDHWEADKMFVGVWGMVTSRIYRKDFVDRFHIRFEQGVPFGEDFMFNIEAYHRAEKILYLPRLIGYHYYINGTSLVQSEAKTAEVILSYARGFKILFDRGLECGIYMNPTISRLCSLLSKFILNCPDMTEDVRTEIREMLGPFIEKTTRMKANKIYSEAAAREAYELPRRVILDKGSLSEIDEADILYSRDFYFEDEDASKILLRNILADNSSTDVGQYYDFPGIFTLSEFKKRLPLTTYEDYETVIRLTTEIGEENVISNQRTIAYVSETDSTGKLCRFPCTMAHTRPFAEAFDVLLKNEKLLVFSDLYNQGIVNNDETMEVSAFGIVIAHIMVSGKSEALNSDILVRNLKNFGNRDLLLYTQMFFALKNKSHTLIISANTRNVYDSFCLMEKYHTALCDDIEYGTIRGIKLMGLEKESLKKLLDYIKPDKERARELREIFARGFDEPIARKIWPALKGVAAKGYGVYRIYSDNLKRYIGDLKNTEPGIFGPEAFIATRYAEGLFKMDLSSAYYEFIPFENGRQADSVLTINEVQTGCDYRLVITTSTGLYRYELDHVIRVETVEDKVPVISYQYDIKSSFFYNEHYYTERDIYDAVCELRREMGLDIDDYSYHPDEENGYIELCIELHADSHIGESVPEKCEEIILRSLTGQKDLPKEEYPFQVNVSFDEPETSQLRSEMLSYKMGISYSQIHPVRLF